jgi:UDP-N-acetylmuramoyl-L-alanyl-D-glutamate--2,6-diaminopimelate ligase
MGAVAAAAADRTWITSDNPRSEDPAAICADVLAGYEETTGRRSRSVAVIVDRREGIRAAIAAAGRGDIVVVAGKGHEDYQLVGGERRDFSDRALVRSLLGVAP